MQPARVWATAIRPDLALLIAGLAMAMLFFTFVIRLAQHARP
jgi:hypothetical protein